MLSVCMPTITDVCTDDHQHPVVSLRFDEDAWSRPRAYDGFVLLVALPELPHTVQELVAVVRAKDAPSQRGSAIDCSRDL